MAISSGFTADELDALLRRTDYRPAGVGIRELDSSGASLRVSDEYVRVGDRLCPRWIELAVPGDPGAASVSGRVEVVGGVPKVVWLTFQKRSQDERDVRQSDLRKVEVGSLITLLAGWTVTLQRDGSGQVVATPGTQDLEMAIDELQSTRRRTITPEFLEEVALVYRDNIGGKPTKAVEERYFVAQRTASKWITEARKLGFLPPTTRGQKKA